VTSIFPFLFKKLLIVSINICLCSKSICSITSLIITRSYFLINFESDIDIQLHDNSLNLHIFEKYEIKKTIQKALQPRVDLPSGGYIIIEPTEA